MSGNVTALRFEMDADYITQTGHTSHQWSFPCGSDDAYCTQCGVRSVSRSALFSCEPVRREGWEIVQ